jgi:hypothetical protein
MPPFSRPFVLCRHSSFLHKNCFRQFSNNNFVETAGFVPGIQSKDYANKKLLLLPNGRHQTYADVNVASGRYAAMLSRNYGVKVKTKNPCWKCNLK